VELAWPQVIGTGSVSQWDGILPVIFSVNHLMLCFLAERYAKKYGLKSLHFLRWMMILSAGIAGWKY